MTDQVVRLFGDDLWEAWSETIARAALYTLTDEHIRHALSGVEAETAANAPRAALLPGN